MVVVGYGVQQKKLVTGATVQVKGGNPSKTKHDQCPAGASGTNSRCPDHFNLWSAGEAMKVNIRGLGTIGNSGPLYVVDGVLTGDITYLNAADIESIDILKDAASAAIYGSQAANGSSPGDDPNRKTRAGFANHFDAYAGRAECGQKGRPAQRFPVCLHHERGSDKWRQTAVCLPIHRSLLLVRAPTG